MEGRLNSPFLTAPQNHIHLWVVEGWKNREQLNDSDSDTERQSEKNEERKKASGKYKKIGTDVVLIHLWFIYAAVQLCHACSQV